MTNARRSAAVAVLAGSALLAAGRAEAYVRYVTDAGRPYYWSVSCTGVTVYLHGFTQMTHDEVAKSIAAAAHAWSPDQVSCPGGDGGVTHPYFEIVPTMSESGSIPGVGYDSRNSVIFRTDNWTMSGNPNGKAYDAAALALTSVVARPDGRIVDADVEINAIAGVGPNWANLDPGVVLPPDNGQDHADLQNAITHEFGHFIGLNHTCLGETEDLGPVDDQGVPVPRCFGAPLDIQQTVMFASTRPNEISKRFLSPDDIRAVCDIYPPALDPQNCSLDLPYEGCRGGCRTGGNAGGGAACALLACTVLFARARRRRPRPGRR
jgi:hypothetical protein